MSKIALVSHQTNIKKIDSWHSLGQYQKAYDLSLFFGKQVEVTPWAEFYDPYEASSKFETVILDEFDEENYKYTPYKKKLIEGLEKGSFKKACLYESWDIKKFFSYEMQDKLRVFHENSIEEEFNEFLTKKPEVVYGDETALSLWTPYTNVITNQGFKFNTSKRFEKVTYFKDEWFFLSKADMRLSLENVFKQLVKTHCNDIVFVLPNLTPLYYGEFRHISKNYARMYGITIMTKTFDKKVKKFKQTLFDLKKNEVNPDQAPIEVPETY